MFSTPANEAFAKSTVTAPPKLATSSEKNIGLPFTFVLIILKLVPPASPSVESVLTITSSIANSPTVEALEISTGEAKVILLEVTLFLIQNSEPIAPAPTTSVTFLIAFNCATTVTVPSPILATTDFKVSPEASPTLVFKVLRSAVVVVAPFPNLATTEVRVSVDGSPKLVLTVATRV